MAKTITAFAIAFVIILAGCSGGSGGSGGQQNPPPINPPITPPVTPPIITTPDPRVTQNPTDFISINNPPPSGPVTPNPNPMPAPTQQNPCQFALNNPGTSFVACNRARIPGLTPLYDMVDTAIAANMSTVPDIGVVIDGQITNSINPTHGDLVVEAFATATPRNLFRYVIVDTSKTTTVNAFKRLGSMSKPSGGFIINISQANLFSTSENTNLNLISPGDVQNVGSLLVVAAGNNGPGREPDFVFNPGNPILQLENDPNQPAHNAEALRQIHELTGSLLIVTGLDTPFALTDENGFHEGYVGNRRPSTHQSANRCGNTMQYCVAAPYVFYRYDSSRGIRGVQGTSFAAPLVAGTLVNLRYVWPFLTNKQLVRLSCVTAIDLGATGIDPVYGCGQFSVSGIWKPTGELVDDPLTKFSLTVTTGAIDIAGASLDRKVSVTGYENNEFARDYEVTVPTSSSQTSLSVEPAVSWESLNTMLDFRDSGSLSLPVAQGRGSAAHIFKDTFLFMQAVDRNGSLGISHKSGFSVAFEREADSFFGSVGSGSYQFGDTNKVVASFDRRFNFNKNYGMDIKVATAYGKMEPDISLIDSAHGQAQTARAAFVREKNNFETSLEMSHNTGLKGTISIQNADYTLKPVSETVLMLKMRFAL